MHMGVPGGKVNQGQSKTISCLRSVFPYNLQKEPHGKTKVSVNNLTTNKSTAMYTTHSTFTHKHLEKSTSQKKVFCPFSLNTANMWAIKSTLNLKPLTEAPPPPIKTFKRMVV